MWLPAVSKISDIFISSFISRNFLEQLFLITVACFIIHFDWTDSLVFDKMKKNSLIPPYKIIQIPCKQKQLYINSKILPENKIPRYLLHFAIY